MFHVQSVPPELSSNMPMKHALAEEMDAIDVFELRRLGAFARPMNFPFRFLKTCRDRIEYRRPTWQPDRPPQIYHVEWTHCHFGGSRPWLICCFCNRRVAKLYPRALSLYCCRACGDVAYKSQLRGKKSRLYRKAQKIRWRLHDDGKPGISTFPPRWPGMWNKTYRRLESEGVAIELELMRGGAFQPRSRRKYR